MTFSLSKGFMNIAVGCMAWVKRINYTQNEYLHNVPTQIGIT